MKGFSPGRFKIGGPCSSFKADLIFTTLGSSHRYTIENQLQINLVYMVFYSFFFFQ